MIPTDCDLLRTLAILVSAYDVSMIPTDCFVLRTLAILQNIRISRDCVPLLCSYFGGFQILLHTYEQARVCKDLGTLVS